MESIHMAAGKIAFGAGELFISAGVESMTRIPMGGFNPSPNPNLYSTRCPKPICPWALRRNISARNSIFRARSRKNLRCSATKKLTKADLSPEIIPIKTKASEVTKDGCIRADASLEAMAGLAPAFDAAGTVTAATSSPITDGASAVMVASESYADKNGLPKLARIKSMAVVGLAPENMGLGPVVDASRKALARAGLETSKSMDILIELNEAFAVQLAMAVIKELNIDTKASSAGEVAALALGHPLGASGARITGKAAYLLHKLGKKYALATQCAVLAAGRGLRRYLRI